MAFKRSTVRSRLAPPSKIKGLQDFILWAFSLFFNFVPTMSPLIIFHTTLRGYRSYLPTPHIFMTSPSGYDKFSN